MTFTSLTASKTTEGSIKRWVNHSEIDSEQILLEAQTLIYETMRVREMRSEFSALSIAVGDSSKALPTGFLDPIGLWDITNNRKLRLRLEENLQNRRTYTSNVLDSGDVYEFAIFEEALQFPCKYEEATTLKLLGFKQPAALAATTNETNFLTTRYPHLLRCACLVGAYSFRNNDERAQAEMTKLSAFIQKTNAETELSYRGLELDLNT